MIVKRGKGDFNQAYRPCRISEVYGQDSIVQVIKNGLDDGDLPNRILISGPVGSGKTTLSRIIGMGLLCLNRPTSNPCCECDPCKRIIARGLDTAYREYNPDHFSREKNREGLNLQIGRSPRNRKRQVFVFNECHDITDQLITPLSMKFSPYYCMIFCSTKPESVNERIKEGCKIFDLEKYPPAEVSRLLRDVCKSEKIRPKKKIIDSIVAKADFSIRRALILLNEARSDDSLSVEKEKHIIKKRGVNNIIVVAPHGAGGDKDDDFTNTIAWEICSRLNCYAVINEKYSKDEVNLNRIDKILGYKKADIKSEFLHVVSSYKDEIKMRRLDPLIIYLHGIKEKHIDKWGGKDAKILIGYGQGEKVNGKRPHKTTLNQRVLKKLKNELSKAKLNPESAPVGSGYCARSQNNLNQLFNQKIRQEYYDHKVRSVQLEIRANGLREKSEQAIETGYRISESLRFLLQTAKSGTEETIEVDEPFLYKSTVVRLSDIIIDTDDEDDLNYMFRYYEQNDSDLSNKYESDITELADSIDKNGLVHPLVLLQTDDDKYKILCGFRRYKALVKLEKTEVPAKIYTEGDLIHSQFLQIALAENTKRRNLNPIEIGAFLDSARGAGRSKKTYEELGTEYGKTLGIGTSHGTVEKYLILNEMRVKSKSKEIVNDLLKKNIPFGIAAEGLAFIKNPKDRNALYEKVVKRLKPTPTRPQLDQIKKLLKPLGNGFASTLQDTKIQEFINNAEMNGGAETLIEQLKLQSNDASAKQRDEFRTRVDEIREKTFNGEKDPKIFNVIPPDNFEWQELTIEFKIDDSNYDEVSEAIDSLLKGDDLRELIKSIVSTTE